MYFRALCYPHVKFVSLECTHVVFIRHPVLALSGSSWLTVCTSVTCIPKATHLLRGAWFSKGVGASDVRRRSKVQHEPLGGRMWRKQNAMHKTTPQHDMELQPYSQIVILQAIPLFCTVSVCTQLFWIEHRERYRFGRQRQHVHILQIALQSLVWVVCAWSTSFCQAQLLPGEDAWKAPAKGAGAVLLEASMKCMRMNLNKFNAECRLTKDD